MFYINADKLTLKCLRSSYQYDKNVRLSGYYLSFRNMATAQKNHLIKLIFQDDYD